MLLTRALSWSETICTAVFMSANATFFVFGTYGEFTVIIQQSSKNHPMLPFRLVSSPFLSHALLQEPLLQIHALLPVYLALLPSEACLGEQSLHIIDPSQASVDVICRELGFVGGMSQLVAQVPDRISLSPPWLAASGVCNGDESAFLECGPFNFGDTEFCGHPQRLVCTDADAAGACHSPFQLYQGCKPAAAQGA